MQILFKVDKTSQAFFHALFKRKSNNVSLSKEIKNAAYPIALDLEKGNPLSKAIKNYPEIFPEYYIKNIYATEITGVLQETLNRLSKYLKSEKTPVANQKFSKVSEDCFFH